MSAKVIEVKHVSQLLLEDPELMKRWKEASRAGRIEAKSAGGRNLAMVSDDDLLSFLTARYSGIPVEEWEEE